MSFDRLIRTVAKHPASRAAVEAFARTVIERDLPAARRLLQGHEERDSMLSAQIMRGDEDASPNLLRLGPLVGIQYLARKGDGKELELFDHEFDRYRPWLYVALSEDDKPNSLVIIRGRSKYDITTHGIEG